MGGRGASSRYASSKTQMPGDEGYGTPSPDGTPKKAIAWHGSSAEFDAFDPSFANPQHQMYGAGFYLSSSPERARLYGDYLYKVEITYSTDNRTAKKTGREKDFQYSTDTGYWVIPHGKADNIRILGREKVR